MIESTFTWDKLQDEQLEWQLANFGPQEPYRCLLGIVEELGEWDTAEEEADIIDAIGDVLIYSSGYCSARGWRLAEIMRMSQDPNTDFKFQTGLQALGKLCRSQLKSEQNIRGSAAEHDAAGKNALAYLFLYLGDEIVNYEMSLLQAAQKTWEGVVSKRNWKSNPTTGSTESK